MNYALMRRRAADSLPSPPKTEREGRTIRRIFDNSQIIERFGKWLLICEWYSKRFAGRDLDKEVTALTRRFDAAQMLFNGGDE